MNYSSVICTPVVCFCSNHCTFLTLHSCEDIVMEHQHNNITGKAFTELAFTVVCTGCKQCSRLPWPMSLFSLEEFNLFQYCHLQPLQGFFFWKLAAPSLNCLVVQPLENLAPGFIDTLLSDALQPCASVSHYCLLAPTSQQDYFCAL